MVLLSIIYQSIIYQSILQIMSRYLIILQFFVFIVLLLTLFFQINEHPFASTISSQSSHQISLRQADFYMSAPYFSELYFFIKIRREQSKINTTPQRDILKLLTRRIFPYFHLDGLSSVFFIPRYLGVVFYQLLGQWVPQQVYEIKRAVVLVKALSRHSKTHD